MATTFNAQAFASRIAKAADRARKAQQNSASMDQRVQKRLDRLQRTEAATVKAAKDATLTRCILDKVGAERDMAAHDAGKAEANVRKMMAYVAQLHREGELKVARAEAKAAKSSKGPATWYVKTDSPEGSELPFAATPIAENDGTLGKLVGRAKRAEVPVGAFAYCLGDECVGLVNDVERATLVCNEMEYAIDVDSKDGFVILTKLAK
jgi:hypothetical protein